MPKLRAAVKVTEKEFLIYSVRWCSTQLKYVLGEFKNAFPRTFLGRIETLMKLEFQNNSKQADEVTTRLHKHMFDIGKEYMIPDNFLPHEERINCVALLEGNLPIAPHIPLYM